MKRKLALAGWLVVVAMLVGRNNTNDTLFSPLSAPFAVFLPVTVGGNGAPDPSNWGFEDGVWDGPQYQWIVDVSDPSGKLNGPYLTHYIEIRTPAGWGVAWVEMDPCKQTPAYFSGRPEVSPFEAWKDPLRVFAGEDAAKLFTYWHCHKMALFQRANFERGEYQFSVMGHSWYASCGDPHLPWPSVPGEGGRCMRAPFEAHDLLQVCVDPTAGIDPWSGDVICGEPVEQYGRYGPRIYSPWVRLSDGPATVFLRADCDFPFEHNDVYWDDLKMDTRQ